MYNNYYQQPQPQQVVQVNGRASVDTIRMAPNSSMLVMDTSAPIVWLCVSDGVGRVTSTPYDISPHKDAEQQRNEDIEQRLARLETFILGMVKNDEKSNAKSDTNAIPD